MSDEVEELIEFLRRRNYDLKFGKKSKLDFPVSDFKKFNLERFKSIESNLENDYNYSEFNSIDGGDANVKLLHWVSENLLIFQDEKKSLLKFRRIGIMTAVEIQDIINEASLSQISLFNRIGTDFLDLIKWSKLQSTKIYQIIRKPKN
jgi:hypothetical protein